MTEHEWDGIGIIIIDYLSVLKFLMWALYFK